jgi:death-on-curing protein
MILLTVNEIVVLHDQLINETGGSSGIRDMGLLESAIYSAIQSFDDIEVYPTIKEKSARFAFAITQNHPFVDGNKRIGIFVMLMSLRLNNITLKYTQQELIELGLGIASSLYDYNHVLNWIDTHQV